MSMEKSLSYKNKNGVRVTLRAKTSVITSRSGVLVVPPTREELEDISTNMRDIIKKNKARHISGSPLVDRFPIHPIRKK